MSKKKAPGPGEGRAEILSAALKEFAETGFRGASTSSIARRAKVTQPLIYHHFKSKQALWDAVVDGLFGGLRDALLATMQQMEGEDRLTRLERLLRTFIQFAGRHPEVPRLIRAESLAGGAPFDALYSKWVSQLLELYRHEVEAGVADGTLRDMDPRFAYFAIVGVVTQPFSERQVARRAFDLDFSDEQTVDEYADFVVDLLLGGMATRRPRRAKPS